MSSCLGSTHQVSSQGQIGSFREQQHTAKTPMTTSDHTQGAKPLQVMSDGTCVCIEGLHVSIPHALVQGLPCYGDAHFALHARHHAIQHSRPSHLQIQKCHATVIAIKHGKSARVKYSAETVLRKHALLIMPCHLQGTSQAHAWRSQATRPVILTSNRAQHSWPMILQHGVMHVARTQGIIETAHLGCFVIL